MPFVLADYTPAAAVPLSGTFTIPYPAGTNIGSFAGAREHKAYIEGLQNFIATPAGFTVTPQASNILITNLGATAWPANKLIKFQLEFIGTDQPGPYDAVAVDSTFANVMCVRFGAPIAAAATSILATTAVADALLKTLAAPYQMDQARNVVYVSSGAGDTTQTVTVRGFDRYGVAMTETKTLNGVTAVPGTKAFYKVVSYQASAALAGNLSLGIGAVFGFPVLLERAGFVIAEKADDATPTAGVFAAGVSAVPTATTGDVRGTWAPNTAPNGAHVYEVIVAVPDRVTQLPQFAG